MRIAASLSPRTIGSVNCSLCLAAGCAGDTEILRLGFTGERRRGIRRDREAYPFQEKVEEWYVAAVLAN